jgi:hypothetical protein
MSATLGKPHIEASRETSPVEMDKQIGHREGDGRFAFLTGRMEEGNARAVQSHPKLRTLDQVVGL